MPIILIIGAVIIAIGFTIVFFFSPDPTPNDNIQIDTNNEMDIRVEDIEEMNDPETTSDSDSEPTASADGTYQGSGEYLTPARTEQFIEVSLTLENGIVTDSTILFDGKPEGESSNDNQARFADAYKTEVVGKPLGEISLSRVGGASLTSRAFNDAVVEITAKATTGTTS